MDKEGFVDFLLEAYDALLQPIPNPLSPFNECSIKMAETKKPMTSSEIKEYRSLVERLDMYPNSIRLFNDLHQISLDILKERGVIRVGLFSIKRGYYQLNRPEGRPLQEMDALAVIYRKTFLGDRLNIIDSYYTHSKECVLYRLRGYETMRMLEEGKIMGILNEPVLELAKSLFLQFHPSCLELSNGIPEEKRVFHF